MEKFLIRLVLISFIISSFVFAENITVVKNPNEPKYTVDASIETPMKTLSRDAFWGSAMGAIAGVGAIILLRPNKEQHRYFEVPIAIGAMGGSAFGVYEIMARDDFYVEGIIDINPDAKLEEADYAAMEKENKEKVLVEVKRRLDMPVKYAFQDTVWGGIWGFLMGAAAIWLPEEEKIERQRLLLEYGILGGATLGLSSSLLYDLIQSWHIKTASPAQTSIPIMFAYYDQKHSSYNLMYRINF